MIKSANSYLFTDIYGFKRSSPLSCEWKKWYILLSFTSIIFLRLLIVQSERWILYGNKMGHKARTIYSNIRININHFDYQLMHYCFLLCAEFKPTKRLQNIFRRKLYTSWQNVMSWIPAQGTMLCVVIPLVLFTPFSLGFTAKVVKNLTTYLFDTNAYNSSLWPSSNQMAPMDLKGSFDLISLNKQDELEEKLITTAYLTPQ